MGYAYKRGIEDGRRDNHHNPYIINDPRSSKDRENYERGYDRGIEEKNNEEAND